MRFDLTQYVGHEFVGRLACLWFPMMVDGGLKTQDDKMSIRRWSGGRRLGEGCEAACCALCCFFYFPPLPLSIVSPGRSQHTLNQGHFRSWSWFFIFSNLKMLHLILIWPPRFSQVNVKNERSKPKDERSGKELPEAGNEACRGWSSAAGSWSEGGEPWRATSVSSATNSFASSSFFTSSLCSHCSHSVMMISEHWTCCSTNQQWEL